MIRIVCTATTTFLLHCHRRRSQWWVSVHVHGQPSKKIGPGNEKCNLNAVCCLMHVQFVFVSNFLLFHLSKQMYQFDCKNSTQKKTAKHLNGFDSVNPIIRTSLNPFRHIWIQLNQFGSKLAISRFESHAIFGPDNCFLCICTLWLFVCVLFCKSDNLCTLLNGLLWIRLCRFGWMDWNGSRSIPLWASFLFELCRWLKHCLSMSTVGCVRVLSFFFWVESCFFFGISQLCSVMWKYCKVWSSGRH